MGSGAERTHSKAAAGGPSKVEDCGTNGAGSAAASRPRSPTFRTDKPGGTAGE